MFDSYKLFKKNIDKSSELIALFEFSKKNLPSTNFDDLLRAHLVYSVSAFDKLMHDLISTGMVEIFLHRRTPTSRYLKEGVSLEIYNKMVKATVPPAEYFFENEVARKLSFIAFQNPDKVAEGLSYIWNEPHKWKVISDSMGLDMHSVKTTLKTIVARRNQIVHEGDIDISTGQKYLINMAEVEDVSKFILSCGNSIYKNVKI